MPVAAQRCTVEPTGVVTVASLVEDLVDLDRLARRDVTPFARRLASSTNLATDSSDSTTWYADEYGHIRAEGSEKVVLESSHPGALVRFWTANPNGRLRVYLDGSATPAIDVNMVSLFDSTVDLFAPPFVYRSARGANLVYPITWRSSAKITVTSPTLYYTFDYREYADDVVVEPYPGAPGGALSCAVDRVEAAITEGSVEPVPNATFTLDSSDPESAAEVVAGKAGAVVRWLRLRLDTDDRATLSGTALVVDVDGVRTIEVPLASVLVPMSDAAPVDALALRSEGADWVLRLPMPFAERIQIALENRGGGAVRAGLDLATRAMDVSEDVYRLFAQVVGPQDYDVSVWPAEPAVASIEGEGRYVGLVYELGNPDSWAQWWGEGDPTITIDGGESMRGTGTEDHFLFAFCSTERFTSAFSGQTRANAHDNGGLVTLYRFHSSDDYAFSSSFDFRFELLAWGTHHSRTIVMPVSSVSWFYGKTTTRFGGATGASPVLSPVSIPASFVNQASGFVTCD